MKKVWLGVGIGCGALVLLAVVGFAVVGFWAKNKLEGAAELGQEVGRQEERLQALNSRFAFRAPPEGAVMTLHEERLQAYLSIREEALPVFARFEKGAKAFERENDGKQAGFGEAMKAAGMLAELTTKMRATFIEGLERQSMSPREFHAITQSLYSTVAGAAALQAHHAMQEGAEQLDKAVQEVEDKLADESLKEEERAALRAQLDALRAQQESMEEAAREAEASAEQQAVVVSNAKLLERHKERIEKVANPAFDVFTLGGGAGTEE